MLIVASLVDTGPAPSLVNKDFLPPAWKKSTKTIEKARLRTVNHKLVSVEGVQHSLLVCASYL